MGIAFLDPLLHDDPSTVGDDALVNRQLVSLHLVAGIFFLLYALIAGFLYSLQLNGNYPFPNWQLMSAGKVALVHSNVFVYGALFNLYFMALYWVVPALMKRRVAGTRLGLPLFGLWNLSVVLTILGIHFGKAQPLPWGETPNGLASLINGHFHPFFADELIVLSLILAIAQFFLPLSSKGTRGAIPVGAWFITGGLIWFLLGHLHGSYGYELLPGAASAVFSAVYINSVIGMTLGALGIGILFYFLPALTKQPVWSYGMAMLGFWGFALFYPLSSVSHYLNSTLPVFSQSSSVVFSVATQLAILTILLNFFMALRGAKSLYSNIALRYFTTGLIFYVFALLLGIFEGTYTVQSLIQYTEWTPAKTMFVLYGVFGFWLFGVIHDIFPRLVDKVDWVYTDGVEFTYWLNVLGIVGYCAAGLFAGTAQGGIWQGGSSTWDILLQTLHVFWQFQTITLILLIVANAILVFNMITTRMPSAVLAELEQE